MALPALLAVSAAVSTVATVQNAKEQKRALKEQKKLQKTREAELAEENLAREQAKKKAASSGVRVGRGSLVSSSATGMGTQMAPPISSRNTLFGN